MNQIHIVNGPNMEALHLREKELYGGFTLTHVENICKREKRDDTTLHFFASNSEGAIIDYLLGAIGRMDGLIINPAALTHTSLALSDTLSILREQGVPVVEVHLSNIFARGEERSKTITGRNVDCVIAGAGDQGYLLAMAYLYGKLEQISRSQP